MLQRTHWSDRAVGRPERRWISSADSSYLPPPPGTRPQPLHRLELRVCLSVILLSAFGMILHLIRSLLVLCRFLDKFSFFAILSVLFIP